MPDGVSPTGIVAATELDSLAYENVDHKNKNPNAQAFDLLIIGIFPKFLKTLSRKIYLISEIDATTKLSYFFLGKIQDSPYDNGIDRKGAHYDAD